MAVHANQQRTKIPNPETPQGLRVKIVQINIFDAFDPAGLQRRSATHNRQIGAAQFGERRQRTGVQAALADDEPNPILLHQGSRKALHPGRGCCAYTKCFITRGEFGRYTDLLHVRRGMHHRVAAQIKSGWTRAIKHRNLRRVANTEQGVLQGHGIADPQLPGLSFVDRHVQGVVRHIRTRKPDQPR